MKKELETFVCDQCGRTFPTTTPDAEARAAAADRFGPEPPGGWAVVCDECFRLMVPPSSSPPSRPS